MSNLVGLDGLPVRKTVDQQLKQDIAALAQQLSQTQQGLFHMNILLDFVIDQLNAKLRDSEGLSPIALQNYPEFAEARSKEIIAALQEHEKARRQGREAKVDVGE
jgi:hypothetical protein